MEKNEEGKTEKVKKYRKLEIQKLILQKPKKYRRKNYRILKIQKINLQKHKNAERANYRRSRTHLHIFWGKGQNLIGNPTGDGDNKRLNLKYIFIKMYTF